MKKDIPELSKLELNQRNVVELFVKSKATPQTAKPIPSSFYAKDSSRKAPIIQLDKDFILQHRYLIRYWLGQVQTIHQQQPKLTPGAGIINYQGQKWANDNRALFALYYLATATNQMPHFEDGEKYAETTILPAYYDKGLKPTFSPNDPRFNIKDAKKALKDLGIDIDDQTHVD